MGPPLYYRQTRTDFFPVLFTVLQSGCGEIAATGRTVVMGYHRDKGRMREAFTEDERWFRLGDLGTLDKDGFYYVTSRIKEIIITSGKN